VRLLVASGLAAAFLLVLPSPARAHALVVRSNPAAGASLTQVPRTLTITFSEAPEPGASSIRVLDASGGLASRGPARPVPSDRLQLAVSLGPLLNGVYTVRWKTISTDDGHASAGSFTFGVGPSAYASSAGPAPALAAAPASAGPAIVAGHWIFYVGLGLLVGGAWVSLFALGAGSRRLLMLTLGGALVMVAGLALYGIAQALADGTRPAELPSTSLGLGLVAQAVPGLAAAAAVEVALCGRGRLRRAALGLATLLAAVTMLVHVLTTHAAAGRLAWVMVAAQWAHLSAFAAWIGGLAALLVALGGRPSQRKAAAVRRFSQVAAASFVVVGLTGLVRAQDEVAAWSALVATLFGQLVLVKVGLLAVLAALGAANRFRSVPAAERSLGGLRRIGRLEVGVGAVVVAASAILTSLVPPALVASAPRQPPPPRLVVEGRAPGARARLEVSPAYPGLNRFTLRVDDPRTGRALAGQASLRFRMPARPELGDSTLALRRGADGSHAGAGPNLSLIGLWSVSAVLRRAPAPVEVPLQVSCRPSPQQLQQMTMGRMLMVHGLPLANGWQLEAYLNPGRAGRTTVHLVFSDQRGGPVEVSELPVATARQGHALRTIRLQRLAYGSPTPNQFYGPATLAAGRVDFQVRAVAADGRAVSASFTVNVPRDGAGPSPPRT
jgi:methionine-rich copper-binding protein CopC/putative copper export protein